MDDRLDEIRAKRSPVAVQYDGDSDDAHTARINPMMSHWIRHTLAMPAMTENLDVTQLLSASTRGDEGAASKLMPVVYDELRRLSIPAGSSSLLTFFSFRVSE